MNTIASLISIIFLAYIIFFLYNSYRTDELRQALFDVRDSLFDEALEGRISFDSNAYKATRTMLNGMIRYGHRLNFSNLLSFRYVMRRASHKAIFDGFERAAFLNASATEKKLCKEHINKAHFIVALHVLKSPAVMPILVPMNLLIFLIIRLNSLNKAAGWLVSKFRRSFVILDEVAFSEGRIA
jgi:hypothetical protein